jgi:glycosyltransferase 2 family protein
VYIPGRFGSSDPIFHPVARGAPPGRPRSTLPAAAQGTGFLMKRLLRVGFSILLSLVLILLCFRGTDPGAVWRALTRAHPAYLVLAVALSLFTFVVRALRWRVLLSHLRKGIPFSSLFSCTVIGFMVSYVIPGRIGELTRPVLLAVKERMSKGSVIATVAVARMMDFLTVLLLFSVYLIGFSSRLPKHGSALISQFRSRGLQVGGAILILVIALYAAVLLRSHLFERLEAWTRPGGWARGAVDFLHAVIRGFEVLKGGKALAGSMLLTLATWCIIDLSILAGLRAFEIQLGFEDVFLLLAFLAVGIAVPTPGGLGSYQWLGQACLVSIFGVQSELALAAIWVQWGVAELPVMALGAILIWKEGMTLGQVGRMVGKEGAVSS